MNHLYKICVRFFLLLCLLVSGLTKAVAAEPSDEERRLRDVVYKTFDGTDNEAFYKACRNYRDYFLRQRNMHDYYNAWAMEVVYDINHDQYYPALKKTKDMQADIEARRQLGEQYRVNYLMGVFYGNRDNNEMCVEYLEKAASQIDAAKYASDLVKVYQMLTNINIFDDTDAGLKWADKALQQNTSVYQRCSSLALKSMVLFARDDRHGFDECYDELARIRRETPDDYNHTYEDYVEMGRSTFDGDYDRAVALTDSMTSAQDRYLFQSKIYAVKGDVAAENEALRQLLTARQKRNNEISTLEVNDINRDMTFLRMRDENTRARNTILQLAIVVGLVVILALVYFAWSRRRYARRLNEQNRELKKARDLAEESDRMKTAFIRNVSHHIRTPLNIVNGFAHVIGEQVDQLSADERRDIVARISENTEIITTSINHLLKLSRVESIRVSDTDDRVGCNELCAKVVDGFQVRDPQAVKLSYTTSLPDSVTLRTNREALEDILCELLKNANRFTVSGRIIVNSEINKKDKLQITVTDTGKGVPETEVANIFNNFEKVDEFSDGLGLGLPLCKRMAQQIGGDLFLDTKYRQGSRFVLLLPTD